MGKLFTAVVPRTLGFAILFMACSKNEAEQDVETVANQEQAQDSYDLGSILDNAINAQLTASVSLPGARTPLQVYKRQLTDRAAEEEIVISRHPERGNLELFLISPRVVSSVEGSVADHRIVAQEQLKIDSENFAVQTQDLTGDGSTQEIFVSGKNTANGLQQAYVFQLLLSGVEKDVIGLSRIFYQEGSGLYEISFSNKAYYIVYQRLLDQSSYQLELTDLQWNAALGSFVVRKVEIIESDDQLSDDLRAVYRGSAENFFAAIDGLWLRTSGDNGATGAVFLYFDSGMNELLIYADTLSLKENDQVIEVYNVSGMVKSLWNRLTLNVRHKYVYNIQNYFYVTLETNDTIKLFALDGSAYTGNYKRMNAAEYRDYASQSNISAADFQLEGLFTERSDGKRYTFQPDKLVLTEADGKIWQGAYSLFSWSGSNYLDIHLFEQKSLEEFRRSYRIERSTEETPDISVLLLYPVKLLRTEVVNNFSEDIIRLEQEQKIDKRQLESLLPGS